MPLDTTASPALWDWLDQEDDREHEPAASADHVVAILVTHNAEEWLERHLQALQALEPAPGCLLAVDNGSVDATRQILSDAGVFDEVLEGQADWGFGQAVNHALETDHPLVREPEWIWLLHDDCAPAPDALGQLLRGAALREADVVYPKLLQPPRRNYPDSLAEVGQTITRTGRRVLSIDEGDIDQDQTEAAATLGGSTAGMLVSGEAWRALDGLSPELPLHRDGVDFGWRANAAGYGVTTWPQAAVMHRQANRMWERERAHYPAHETDRLAALRLVSARASTHPVLLMLTCWLRALGFLLAKSPSTARAELRALRRFRKTRDAVSSLAQRPAGEQDCSHLLPGKFFSIRQAFDKTGDWLATRYREFTGAEYGSATSLDELTGDDFAGQENRSRYLFSPVLVMVTVLLCAGIIAARTLLGANVVSGGGVLPAPSSVADAWDAYLTPQSGVRGSNAPWLGLAAALGTVTFGHPGWLVVLGLVCGPLAIGVAAYVMLRGFDVSIGTAAGASCAWAGAAVVLGLITAGDISGIVAAIAGPLLVHTWHKITQSMASGVERLRLPAMAAWWLLVLAVVWPFALVLAIIGGLVIVVRDRARAVEVLVTVIPGALFLAPWAPTLWKYPGRMLTGIDPLAWPAYAPAKLATLAGRIMPSGLPVWLNLVFFIGLALLAVVAMASVARRARVWFVAAISVPFIVGAAVSRLVVSVPGGHARALLSVWALVVVAAVLLPIVFWRRDLNQTSSRVVGLSLGALGLLVMGTWAWVGFAGPVQTSASQVPSYVQDVMTSARETRVLMMQRDARNRLRWNVIDKHQPQWGTGERAAAGTHGQELATAVQAFAGGTPPENLAAQLQTLGVSHVWMRGFPEDRLSAIGNIAGMKRAAVDDHTVIWSLDSQISRYQLQAGSEKRFVTDKTIDAASVPRVLVMPDQPDHRWRASVGGVVLQQDPNRPPVSFTVPAEVSGPLEVWLDRSNGTLVWHVFILLALVLLAAPSMGDKVAARRSTT